MKWFLFFISIGILHSCKHNNAQKAETFPVKPVTQINMLLKFLNSNLSTKDILQLNQKALSHSVFTTQDKNDRVDTLKNDNTTIISKAHFGKKESQIIMINSIVVRNYKWNGVDTLQEDILDLDEKSFQSFSFKGKEFYYINAHIMDCSGGSRCLVTYQLIYDIRSKSLSIFSNFRVNDYNLFGDINGDNWLDFLQIENDGGYGMSDTNHFAMNIYSNSKSGNFEIFKDDKGKEYYINGNTNKDYYVGDSMNIDEFYWPAKFK